MLRGGINLTPTYSTVATKSDIKTALKFESDIADAVRPLRQNAPILGKETLLFDDFLSHLFLLNLNAYFGKPYLPALIADNHRRLLCGARGIFFIYLARGEGKKSMKLKIKSKHHRQCGQVGAAYRKKG